MIEVLARTQQPAILAKKGQNRFIDRDLVARNWRKFKAGLEGLFCFLLRFAQGLGKDAIFAHPNQGVEVLSSEEISLSLTEAQGDKDNPKRANVGFDYQGRWKGKTVFHGHKRIQNVLNHEYIILEVSIETFLCTT